MRRVHRLSITRGTGSGVSEVVKSELSDISELIIDIGYRTATYRFCFSVYFNQGSDLFSIDYGNKQDANIDLQHLCHSRMSQHIERVTFPDFNYTMRARLACFVTEVHDEELDVHHSPDIDVCKEYL
ncbi:uncharacterized protein EAF02_007712 [Botrytis sinoallii]|uniref:uncharacterized protein n=1 Tax=Botrytis sinoallii TaxID=1463999 RepID=UPI00190027B1|nr:uncharacterized protein EAF02_007712 [Botrytis sinoallii]KAF7880075.1 hypothetical protein EAF02_007712 [Botrytis sinoallii]